MSPTFPFGKWKGIPYDQVPRDYLTWALENMRDLRKDTRALIESTLARGTRSAPAAKPAPQGGSPRRPPPEEYAGTGPNQGELACPSCGMRLRVTLTDALPNDETVPF